MGSFVRSCLQSTLKLVNSVIGMAGMAMILYSLWMIRVWYKQMNGHWGVSLDSTPPWFIYTFLGIGVSLCVITCSGHIAAETANGHCLSCYMVFVFFLIILEGAITADIFLNRNWEEDFPEDHTGRFNEFTNFVRSNSEICKWAGLVVVAAQAISIFLAMILRALGPDRGSFYDGDDDCTPARLPLLRNQAKLRVCPSINQLIQTWILLPERKEGHYKRISPIQVPDLAQPWTGGGNYHESGLIYL